MGVDTAIMRLRAHANMPGREDGIQGIGGCILAWRKFDAKLELAPLVLNFVEALQVLNESQQTAGPVPMSVPIARDVSYFVSCVLSDLSQAARSGKAAQDPEIMSALVDAISVVAYVWSQFVAGDIDNLL